MVVHVFPERFSSWDNNRLLAGVKTLPNGAGSPMRDNEESLLDSAVEFFAGNKSNRSAIGWDNPGISVLNEDVLILQDRM